MAETAAAPEASGEGMKTLDEHNEVVLRRMRADEGYRSGVACAECKNADNRFVEMLHRIPKERRSREATAHEVFCPECNFPGVMQEET